MNNTNTRTNETNSKSRAVTTHQTTQTEDIWRTCQLGQNPVSTKDITTHQKIKEAAHGRAREDANPLRPEGQAKTLSHLGGRTLKQIVSSSSLTRDQQSVMRMVPSGNIQTTAIMPTINDKCAAQDLLQLAAQLERYRALQDRRTSSSIHSTGAHKSHN